MGMQPDAASRDTVHETLRGVVADAMRAAAAARPDRKAEELAQMMNALFGLDLTEDAVASTPTAAALARSVESGWHESGASGAELAERLAALVEDD